MKEKTGGWDTTALARSQDAAPKESLKILHCKKCGCSIDFGCCGCLNADFDPEKRKDEDMEWHVFKCVKVKPYE